MRASRFYELIGRMVVGFVRNRYGQQIRTAAVVGVGAAVVGRDRRLRGDQGRGRAGVAPSPAPAARVREEAPAAAARAAQLRDALDQQLAHVLGRPERVGHHAPGVDRRSGDQLSGRERAQHAPRGGEAESRSASRSRSECSSALIILIVTSWLRISIPVILCPFVAVIKMSHIVPLRL